MAPPLALTLRLPAPEQVVGGKYRILKKVGGGGMGLVFLAQRLGTHEQVALKFLTPEPDEDESRLARFLREGKVSLELQHPGAAQLLDFGKDDEGRFFLCFEYVEGEDLREVLNREGRLGFAEAREVTRQLADALAFAHARGIVHRDLKPENVRLARGPRGVAVKLLDFGIARLLKDTGARLTAEGMLAGTPRYMAPEQVKDEPLDGKVDQYALGLVFFELLTGDAAIKGKNVTQILMQQLEQPIPTLASVDARLAAPAVDAFLSRACAKRREARFPSMEAFLAALAALAVDEQRWPQPPAPSGPAPSPPSPPAAERTEVELRRDVAGTEPTSPTDARPTRPSGSTAKDESATRQSPPHRPGPPAQPAAAPRPVTAEAPAPWERPEGLELPTALEREAVPRGSTPRQPRPAPGARRVVGAPPARPRRPWGLVLLVLALSVAVGAGAFWLLGR